MSISAAASSGYSDPNNFIPVFASENAVTAREESEKRAAQGNKELSMFAEPDEPSFWDLLDVINPLQHIPVVNTLYQELTGDKIGVGARLAGGALFGGPIGLIASGLNVLLEGETGDDIGGHVMALFKDEDAGAAMTAQAESQTDPEIAAAASDSAQPEAPQTLAQALEAPAIAVPEHDAAFAAQTSEMPMMFNADGIVPVDAPAAAAAAPVAAPVKPVQLAAAQPVRFMPVPPRTTLAAEKAPPPVTVPVSNGSARSSVPVTGRGPVGSYAPDPVAVQKAMAQQGITETDHPMLKAGVQNTGPGGGADWYAAMNTALDRYQKAGNLAAKPGRSAAEGLQ